MFESFYTSFWQHPLLLWLFPVLYAVFFRPGGSFFERSVLALLFLAVVDPLMTGPVTQALDLSASEANAVMIVFVLLGDFRFFFFVERFGRRDAEARSAYVSAVLLTLVVPVLQAALIETVPAAFANPRHTFLAYELLFIALATVYRFVVLRRRTMADSSRKWLNGITSYVLVYYTLWATADVVILLGADWGFLVRVIPNVLYYGLFIPFVHWTAPEFLKAPTGSTTEAS